MWTYTQRAARWRSESSGITWRFQNLKWNVSHIDYMVGKLDDWQLDVFRLDGEHELRAKISMTGTAFDGSFRVAYFTAASLDELLSQLTPAWRRRQQLLLDRLEAMRAAVGEVSNVAS